MIKNTLVIVLFSLALNLVHAQEQEINPNGYNIFKYPSGTISSEGPMLKGKPEGYWKNYYESGVLKSEGNRKGHELDSIWKFYSEDGVLLSEISYYKGKRHGTTFNYTVEGFKESAIPYNNDTIEGVAYTYYPNGSIKRETIFENGVEQGISYEFAERGDIIGLYHYENGFLLREELINRKNKQGQKTGLWKEFYENRVVKTEGTYDNGLKDGYWREYSKKGLLINTSKYVQGELIEDAEEVANLDVKTEYYGEGRPKYRGTYLNGVPQGTHLWFDENGKITAAKVYKSGSLIGEGLFDGKGMKQGPWKEYYYPTGELKAEGEYKDGEKYNLWKFYFMNGQVEQQGRYLEGGLTDGKWKWFYDNGNLLREEHFRRGREDGTMVEYSDTGRVIAQGEFIDGLEEGQWFYEVGDHREEGLYEAGMKQGIWKHYYTSNNELRFEGEFFDDLPQGKHTWYYDTGQKRLEGKYISGIREGMWRRYNEDGSIMLTIDYEMGKEIRINGAKVKEGRARAVAPDMGEEF